MVLLIIHIINGTPTQVDRHVANGRLLGLQVFELVPLGPDLLDFVPALPQQLLLQFLDQLLLLGVLLLVNQRFLSLLLQLLSQLRQLCLEITLNYVLNIGSISKH